MNVTAYTTKWGGEDWDLVDRILMAGLEVLQLKQPGLLHFFHTHDGMWNDSWQSSSGIQFSLGPPNILQPASMSEKMQSYLYNAEMIPIVC